MVRVRISPDGKLSRGEDEVLERNAEGLFSKNIERDGKEWTLSYDDNLRLIEEHSDGISISYCYEDDELKEKQIENGSSMTIEEYDNGSVVRKSEYADGELKKVRTRLSDGKVEEVRYISSIPRYRFTYDIDGSRLLEAEAI